MAGGIGPKLEKTLVYLALVLIGAIVIFGGAIVAIRTKRSIKNYNPLSLMEDPGNPIPWLGLATPSTDAATHPGRGAEYVFIDAPHGIRAGVSEVGHDIKAGQDTIRKLIAGTAEHNYQDAYAPASDGNDSEAYIKFLASRLAISDSTRLDYSQIVPLVKGITKQENSVELETAYGAQAVKDGIALGLDHLRSQGFPV